MASFPSPPSLDDKTSPTEKLGCIVHPNSWTVQSHSEALNGKLNPWSIQSFVLYGLIILAAQCSFSTGYDISIFHSLGINGMQPFKDTFNSGNSAQATGIIFSIFSIGQLVGGIAGSVICDKFGRRAGMCAGSATVILATSILASSHARNQFLAGRFLLGAGVAITDIGAPTYIIEIAPPQWKGRMSGFYQMYVALSCKNGWPYLQSHFSGANIGYMTAAAVAWGTSTIPNNWSWRIPLIIQIFPATIVSIVVWFCPESPRWLYAHGHEERARRVLIRYHASVNRGLSESCLLQELNDSMDVLEIAGFKSKIHVSDTHERWWDYTPLYNTRNARWRSLMVIMAVLFYQWFWFRGIQSTTLMQFAMNLILVIIGCLTGSLSAALSDKLPRRKGGSIIDPNNISSLLRYTHPVFVYGTLVTAICLALNAGFSAKWASYGDGPKDLRVGNAAAATFFIWGILCSPLNAAAVDMTYSLECLETTARAKGLTLKNFILNISGFILLYTTPIGLAHLQLVFVAMDVIQTILWHFLCVETVGRTLEELQDVFNEKNPVKVSQLKRKITVHER
ncbi:putative MFS lactose permease [Hysterangium stoloniferum]|nr:putative MFS lactose permease [Hysterangium stoloniferum]